MRSRVLIPAVCFLVTLAVLAAVNANGESSDGPRAASLAAAGGPLTTDGRIASLQAAVRSPRRAQAPPYTALGQAYLQKVRETGDAGFYVRAEEALRRAREADPRDAQAVAGTGLLQLGRHDFADALRSGRRALRLAPESNVAFPVLVDALVELGRYPEAEETLQRMIDRRPDLAAYARVSYFRELEGDLAGAVEAMRLAASGGASVPENAAYVQSLLGNLELLRDRRPAARRAYATALAAVPGYAPAEAGLARAQAADGRVGAAARRLEGVVQRLPLPEYVIALGETQLAAGDRAAARETFALVGAQAQLLRASGVDVDVELAIFEADHGDPATAVRTARRAWRSAPSVRSADALGWALTRAGRAREGQRWARRALARGWREPTVLFHAGMGAKAAGDRDTARRLLGRLQRQTPRFSALRAPQVRRALEALR